MSILGTSQKRPTVWSFVMGGGYSDYDVNDGDDFDDDDGDDFDDDDGDDDGKAGNYDVADGDISSGTHLGEGVAEPVLTFLLA